MASRDRMMAEIAAGSAGVVEARPASGAYAAAPMAASNQVILCRGCDPEMAKRASEFLPPKLNMCKMVSCTSDDEFIQLLAERKYDAIFFAPGACRFNAAKKPIPGAIEATKGWTLEEYRRLVREKQGNDVPIVETLEEKKIVPLLREALKLA